MIDDVSLGKQNESEDQLMEVSGIIGIMSDVPTRRRR